MTKRIFAAAICAAALGFAGSALADGPVTATLVQPVSSAKLVVGGAVWHCAGLTCAAATAPDAVGSADSCRALAKQVGAVSAYSQFKALDEKGLAQCNATAAVHKPSATATASR